jgi:hypothetical protein
VQFDGAPNGSASAPRTIEAVAATGSEPSRTRPRESHGWTVTSAKFAMRFTLPLSASVTNPVRPPARPTIHTGVETTSPLRFFVLIDTYFSSTMVMHRVYEAHRRHRTGHPRTL